MKLRVRSVGGLRPVGPSDGTRLVALGPVPPPRGVLPVALRGLPGPPGPPGASGAGYVHTQASAATVWTVPHNLGFRPSVAVTSASGAFVVGDPEHLDLNTLRLTFALPISGTARLV